MTGQALKDVCRSVADAADAQILQVVQMVDALERRGDTDEVLAPVRPRLRAIQPARPLRFARLLLMPADSLIVAPFAWRPGTPFLPRNAVMVLACAVRRVMEADNAASAVLAQVDTLIQGATTAQSGLVRQAGALLWPHATIILGRLAVEPPASLLADWHAQCLPTDELAPLTASVAAILSAALALHDHDHSGLRLQEADLPGLLVACEKLGPRAWGMMLSLLVIRVPQASSALLAAAQKKIGRRELAQAAAETALTWLEAETSTQVETVPPNAAAELNRQAGLLETLADQFTDPAQRRRLAQARAALLAGSLQRFETSLQDRVAAPLQALPDDQNTRDAALDTMEASARTLRAFELEARRVGAGAKFDAMMQTVEQTMRETGGLSSMDRARLAEILAGPEAAARMLR